MITGNYKKLNRLHTDTISNRKYKHTLHFCFSLFFTISQQSAGNQNKILLNCCNKMFSAVEGQTVAAKCYK